MTITIPLFIITLAKFFGFAILVFVLLAVIVGSFYPSN